MIMKESKMKNNIFPRPHDRQTVSLHWWDWDEEKIKHSIPIIQSDSLAVVECAE